MDKLIDTAMIQRSNINDYSTILKLMWIEMAELDEVSEIDAVCWILQQSIKGDK